MPWDDHKVDAKTTINMALDLEDPAANNGGSCSRRDEGQSNRDYRPDSIPRERSESVRVPMRNQGGDGSREWGVSVSGWQRCEFRAKRWLVRAGGDACGGQHHVPRRHGGRAFSINDLRKNLRASIG